MGAPTDDGAPTADPAPADGRLRKTVRFAVRSMVVLGGVWLVSVAVLATLGANAARTGADHVRDLDFGAGVDELLDGDLDAELSAAHGRFSSADRFLGSPVLAPARLLPVVGRQLRSAHALAQAGTDVLGASTSALEVLRAEVGDGAPSAGQRLEALARLRDELRAVDDVLASVELGPADALVGPLHDARAEVAGRVVEARTRTGDVLVVVDALHSLLEGPSRYLVLAANNAEMRIGAAMVLSVGTVDIDGGGVEVAQEFEPAGDLLLPEPVSLPAPMSALWGWSDLGSDFRSLALSARFPQNAEVGARQWAALGRGDVDGVLLIDAEGLAALLRIAGPVVVDGERIDADGVLPFLLRDQYEDQARDDLEANEERRDRLRVLAAAALQGLGEADIDLRTMLDQLRDARDGRHLLVWSPDQRVQAAWEILDVDGELSPNSLLVGLANFDNSKLDPYVRVVASAQATEDEGDAVVDVEIEVAHDAPGDLPGYVAGPDGGTSYRGLVSVHLPARATEVDLIGFDGRAALGRDGSTVVIAARVDIDRGAVRTGNLRFRLPRAELAQVRVVPSARIPPIRWWIGDEERLDDSVQAWPHHVP